MLTMLALALSVAQVTTPATVPPTPTPAVPSAAAARLDRGGDPMPAADARIARADSMALAGRVDAAAHLLNQVIDEQTAAGRYAKDAMWHLAMAYDFADNDARLARTLDALARAAATYGDPQMELTATFEATRLHAQLRDGEATADRVDRIRCLLQSPVIPDAVKADYRSRIVDGAKRD